MLAFAMAALAVVTAPMAIPAATANPMCTCDAPRSVGCTPSGIAPAVRIAEKSLLDHLRAGPRAGRRPPYVAVGLPLTVVSRSGLMGWAAI